MAITKRSVFSFEHEGTEFSISVKPGDVEVDLTFDGDTYEVPIEELWQLVCDAKNCARQTE
jgi:hypothetical protein